MNDISVYPSIDINGTVLKKDQGKRTVLKIIFFLVIISSLLLFLFRIYQEPDPRFDDAYMFIRYANNVLTHGKICWNPGGNSVYGCTSPLHLMMIVFMKQFLLFRDADIMKLASTMMAVLTVFIIVLSAGWYTRYTWFHRNYFFWGAVLSPQLFFQDFFFAHARKGMDTMLSTFCNGLLIFFTLRLISFKKNVSVVPVIITAYLAVLARPDNVLCAILFPVLVILILGSTEAKYRLLRSFILWFLMVMVIDLTVKYLIFNDFLPLAFYAKRSGYYHGFLGYSVWNPMRTLLDFCIIALPFIGAIILFGNRSSQSYLISFLVPVCLTFAYLFTVNQISSGHARFNYPFLPYVAVCGIMVMDRFFVDYRTYPNIRKKLLIRVIILFITIFALLEYSTPITRFYTRNFIPAHETPYEMRYFSTKARQKLPELGWWNAIDAVAKIAIHVPDGTIMSMSEYGRIGAAAPHISIIDPLGLHNSYFAHNGFSEKVFFAIEPDMIWLPHKNYTYIVSQILTSETFRSEYCFFPKAFDYGIAIRKNSKYFPQLYSVLHNVWQQTYGPQHEMTDYLANPDAFVDYIPSKQSQMHPSKKTPGKK